MEEIKFRQRISGEFHYWGFIEDSFIPPIVGDSRWSHPNSPMAPMNTENDQYTGMKDKNGKEIYEGDIVSMHQFLFEGVEVEKMISGVIGWMEYGITLKQIRNEYVQEYCGYDAGEGEIYLHSFYGLHEETFEILGNIYENPELIAVDKVGTK